MQPYTAVWHLRKTVPSDYFSFSAKQMSKFLLLSILLFYKKLAIPAFIVSMTFGILVFMLSGAFSLKLVAISYILLSVLFHYFIYEVMNPKEYYFYYNMGLNKYFLWGASLFLSFVIGCILALL
jgi:hypothetical protein